MMEDMLSIKVQIAERFYPLKIKRQDEEKIRKAVKLINDKVLQYKQRYTDKDTQDFMAMARFAICYQPDRLRTTTKCCIFGRGVGDFE